MWQDLVGQTLQDNGEVKRCRTVWYNVEAVREYGVMSVRWKSSSVWTQTPPPHPPKKTPNKNKQKKHKQQQNKQTNKKHTSTVVCISLKNCNSIGLCVFSISHYNPPMLEICHIIWIDIKNVRFSIFSDPNFKIIKYIMKQENMKCDVVGCEYALLQGIKESVQRQCFRSVVSWDYYF